ncbi:MAG: hypothetical protein GY869_15490, partial [Planctomycetes bacterium]|nr:hypothetical protein [Planctomycetota bacterium]
AAMLSATKFVVAYQDFGNSDYGTAVIGDVSGSTISFGLEDVFNTANTDGISAAMLSATKFVVAYRDVGNSSYGTAVIGGTQAYPIGIARETKSAGEEVPVIIQGVSDAHSALSSGSYYYGDLSGNLGLVATPNRIGLAISPTEILMD